MWVGVALAAVAFLYVLFRGPKDDVISTEAFDAGVVASDSTPEPVLVGAD